MPHVAFVPFTGLRVRDQAMLELGMTLPGLQGRATSIGHLPALGLLTLAGMLPDRWTCSYHSAASWDEGLVERIAAEAPTLTAVSALTASIAEAYAFCDRLRERRIPVAIGGLHVTAMPDEAARHADAVITGEGEPVWLQVLRDAERQTLLPMYRAPRSRQDGWPLPRFDLLGAAPPRFTLQTQRGCPLACDFCAASRLLGHFREKPAASIGQELLAIRQLDPQPRIELADDNSFAGSRDCDELLEVLAASGASWFTESDWRIGERPDLLRRLAASGCRQVLVGIESLVFRYPGMGSKQAEMSRMIDAVTAIQEAGVTVNGCFIVGADGETPASLDRLAEFLLASPFAELQLTLQTPFPGTQLHRRLQREGRLLPDRGWSSYTLFDVTYQPDCMSVAELENGFRRVLERVFSADAVQRRTRICRRIWRGAAA